MKQPNGMRLDADLIAEVTFSISASLHQDSGSGENCLYEILGKISVRNVNDESEEEAGELRAWLVQFNEAQIHGIGHRILGDCCSQEISNYWQELFDQDAAEFKTEIQRGWQTHGTDLLIIEAVQVSPKFEASAIGLAALGRTLTLFGRSCDLVACFPEGLENCSYPEADSLQPMSPRMASKLTEAVNRLRDNCVKAGFRVWGQTGICLLNPTHEHPDVLLR
jgi:hypothetical protein